jgi:hypothetical protein
MKKSGSSAMGMAWTLEDGTKIEQVMLISNLVVTIELHNKVIRLGGQGTTRGGHANLEVDRRQEKGGITCRHYWQEWHMQNECKKPYCATFAMI